MPEPLVSICFDDGRATAVRDGARILESHKLRGTFYPITTRVGTQNDDGEYATWEELRGLEHRGHEIGNHTYTHTREWIRWSRGRQLNEISAATGTANYKGGLYSPRTFAYPFGLYDKRLRDLVAEQMGWRGMEFLAARTVEDGINLPTTDPFLLKCFSVRKEHTTSDVMERMETAVREGGWLILTFHHLDNKTHLSTPPQLFEEMLLEILKTKVEIVKLEEGAKKFLKTA